MFLGWVTTTKRHPPDLSPKLASFVVSKASLPPACTDVNLVLLISCRQVPVVYCRPDMVHITYFAINKELIGIKLICWDFRYIELISYQFHTGRYHLSMSYQFYRRVRVILSHDALGNLKTASQLVADG